MEMTSTVFATLLRPLRGQAPAAAPGPMRGLSTVTRPPGLVADTLTLSPGAIARPTPPTFNPPCFGYVTLNPHTVVELATQLNTDPTMLMWLNGWTTADQVVPAGTSIRVPATPIARQQAERFGGRITVEPSTASGGPVEGPAVPYISQYKPEGAGATWHGSYHCGATVLAMVMKAAGMCEGLSDAEAIEAAMVLAATGTRGTSPWGLYTGARASGLQASQPVSNGAGDIDGIRAAVASGRLVAVNGEYHGLYGSTGDYLPHWILVIGITEDGRFLLHDPANPNDGNPIAVTEAQLHAYLAGHLDSTTGQPDGGYYVAIA